MKYMKNTSVILDKNKRYHLSINPNLTFHEILNTRDLYDYEVDSVRDFKPTGIWYGFGGAWLDWCISNDFGKDHFEGNYLYCMEIEEKEILVLCDKEEICNFSRKYTETIHSYGIEKVNWRLVQEKYKGIELPDYERIYSPDWGVDLLWHYGWDVSSGCIWDLDSIISIEKVDIDLHKYWNDYTF